MAANTKRDLSGSLLRHGELERAQELAEQSAKTLQKLASEAPEEVSLQQEAARALVQLGASHLRRGDLAKARKSYTDALTVLSRIPRIEPYHFSVLPVYLGLAETSKQLGDRAAAFAHVASAESALAQLAGRFIGSPNLAASRTVLAQLKQALDP